LRDNQNKFLAVIHEKDEQILQLQQQNEEISKNSKNELYIPYKTLTIQKISP